MHVSVPFFLDEGRMVREIVFLRMFQNKIAAGEENISGKNLVRQGGKALEGIGRVSKNDIVSAGAKVQEVEDIAMNHIHYGGYAEGCRAAADEG